MTLQLAAGLIGGCGGQNYEFFRVSRDGSDSVLFRVPAGKSLVVTDIDWRMISPDGAAAAGELRAFRLWVENLADPDQTSPVVDSTLTLSSVGEGGKNEHLTTGVVVSSAARLCPELPTGHVNLMLHGYILKDE